MTRYMQALAEGAGRQLGRVKPLFEKDLDIPRYVFVLIAIFVAALVLRTESVIRTEVDTPVRADARQYVLYAYNLKTYGVYSHANTWSPDAKVPPSPDALRMPGYPLFILPFLSEPPTFDDLTAITWAQALISAITVVFVFWLARRVLPIPLALTAAALTAISPQLITMNVYILSETLFCFLLVLAIYLLTSAIATIGQTRLWAAAAAGAVLAAASLTHPMLLYFIVPLAAFLLVAIQGAGGGKKAAVLILGFALLFTPWIARNIATPEASSDNALMLAALRTGAYRDLMYENDPQTYAYPYAFDPGYKDSVKNLGTVFSEIKRAFREAPLEQTRWYLLGKPRLLWSWEMAAGPGDIFIYPVTDSPYRYLPHFRATHAFMRVMNPILVVFMLAGIVIAWLPHRLSQLSREAVVIARMISILLLYHLAVMIAGFPLPRYAIPMRPFLHIMALIPLAMAGAWFISHRARPNGAS